MMCYNNMLVEKSLNRTTREREREKRLWTLHDAGSFYFS